MMILMVVMMMILMVVMMMILMVVMMVTNKLHDDLHIGTSTKTISLRG